MIDYSSGDEQRDEVIAGATMSVQMNVLISLFTSIA